MTFDEILIKVGVDSAAVNRGLKSIQSTVSDFGNQVRNSMNTIFGAIAAPFTLGSIMANMKGAVDQVERLTQTAQNWNASTDFVQDLNNLAQAAGLSGEAIEKMVNKLMLKLPNGANIEQEFWKIADSLNEIKDPADKARYAVDAFGKAGIDMLKVISGSSEEIKQMAAAFSKFNESDIKALLEADNQLDSVSNRITIWSGKILSAFANISRAAGQMSVTGNWRDIFSITGWLIASAQVAAGDASPVVRPRVNPAIDALEKFNQHLDDMKLKSGDASEKIAVLTKRHKELQKEMGKASDEKRFELMEKMATIELEIANIRSKSAHEQINAQIQANELAAKRANLERELMRGREYRPTMGDLANRPGKYGDIARKIVAKEEAIKDAIARGDFTTALNLMDELDADGPVPKPRVNRPQVNKPPRLTVGGKSMQPTMGLRRQLEGIIDDPIAERLDKLRIELQEIKTQQQNGVVVVGKEN